MSTAEAVISKKPPVKAQGPRKAPAKSPASESGAKSAEAGSAPQNANGVEMQSMQPKPPKPSGKKAVGEHKSKGPEAATSKKQPTGPVKSVPGEGKEEKSKAQRTPPQSSSAKPKPATASSIMANTAPAPPAYVEASSEAAAGEATWSAGKSGGNVLTWLAQKTALPTAPQSKGAIEYLNQQQQKSKQQQQTTKGSVYNPPIPPTSANTQGKMSPMQQLTQLTQSNSTAGGEAKNWLAAALTGIKLAPTSESQQSQSAANMLPEYESTLHSGNIPVNRSRQHHQQAQKLQNSASRQKDGGVETPQQQQHQLRGKRRQPQTNQGHQFQDPNSSSNHGPNHNNVLNLQQLQQQQQYETMMKEAQEKHEEALRTDPEYQKKFHTYQSLHASQQVAQQQFIERYNNQLASNSLGARERLDIPVILDLIEKHDVVFICTDTGSGKSTSIPKALLELSPHTRVVSTQPRRTATVSVATRVAELRREHVGEDVGYWIRGEKRGDDQTRLWYMTSYTLLLYLLSHPLEPPFTHIILDEFHERQPDIEVTAALLKLCLKRRTASFKLILMSATLNTEDWEDYFSGLSVASYKQSEPEHPIHDHFMEDVCSLVGMEYETAQGLLQRNVDGSTIEKHCFIAQNLITYINSFAYSNHSILVFLPGRAQVEQFQMWLEQDFSNRVDVVPWHSSVDLSVIEAAIKRFNPRKQKIYLATDIAEVSITIPDVVFVIDLVLVKRPKISKEQPASILYPPLVTQWISKGSVAQRRGRIGRVQQGFYFCLLTSDLVAQLPDYAQPPIENARVDELSLHCLQVVNNPVAIFSICHGQPLVDTINTAMNELSHLGCIINSGDRLAARERIAEIHMNDAWNEEIMKEATELVHASIDQYEYTFIGRLLQLIPVSPQPGMLVFFGFLTGLESLMILASAVTSSLSPFSTNPMDHQRGRRRKHDLVRAMEDTENVMRDMCCGLRSDIVAIMKAVLVFRIRSNELGSASVNVRQWCHQNYLSYEKLVAILDLECHIKNELANFIPFRDVIDPQQLLDQLEGVAAMVMVMTNVAFAAQSVEVTSNGNSYSSSREGAVGIFSDLTSVPDLHSPSCLRWQEGDIIIPVQISLHFSKMLVSFSTAIASHKQFWVSLLLFSHRLRYATFSDDNGIFHVFRITYCGVHKFIETDVATGYAVIQFRELLSSICAALRLLYSNKDMLDDEFTGTVLRSYGLKSIRDLQRDAITAMVSQFFNNNMETITADEVEHDEDDLDLDSILSFELKPVASSLASE